MSTKPPKRHILARVRVVWAIKCENPSSRLTCRLVDEKKGINKKKSLYFTHLPRSPPSTELHQIWRSRRGRGRNHLYQMFWWSVKGCGFCGGSKITISHWQSQSPLTQGWRYRAARDNPASFVVCNITCWIKVHGFMKFLKSKYTGNVDFLFGLQFSPWHASFTFLYASTCAFCRLVYAVAFESCDCILQRKGQR